MKYSYYLSIFLFIVLFGCKKEENSVESTDTPTLVTDKIKNLQNKNDSLLTTFLAANDTISALNSLLKVILKDSTVAGGYVSSQGISISYKNGSKGGILLNFEDGYPSLNKQAYTPLIPANSKSYSPSSKKTIFINPHYLERTSFANSMINLENTLFPKNGYNPPITVLGNAATVDVMTNLSGYGIVHIYSHGWAWPDKKNIAEVYLLTGETENEVTSQKYQSEILKGNIPIVKIHNGTNVYFLSPAVFSGENNFSNDSTIVYGGFCFSFLGGWPNAILSTSKAGAYTGFNWRVQTGKNALWAKSLLDTLSNSNLKIPRSLDYWFTNTPAVKKEYYDAQDKVTVKIMYAGHSDLTLWSSLGMTISPNPASAKLSESIKFTAKLTGKLSSPGKYKWNFGDGSQEQIIANDSTVIYTFTNAGTFNVTVKLLDKNDKQLAYATSKAVISAPVMLPNFKNVEAHLEMKATEKWTAVGKYLYRDNTLHDTSYSKTRADANFGCQLAIPVTFVNTSFSGTTTGKLDSYISYAYTVNGTIDPITKAVTASFSYTYANSRYSNTNTSLDKISFSVSALPLINQDSDGYSYGAAGLSACSFLSNILYDRITPSIPPASVTTAGISVTYTYNNYSCYYIDDSHSSLVSLYFSIK